jgi:hypothetical protein
MEIEHFGFTMLEVLAPIVVAGLTWLSAKLAQLIQAKVKNEYLRGMLVRLDEAVFTAVKDLQQTVVDAIKAATADGKITEVEKQRIKQAAIDNVKSHLGTKGLAELGQILGLTITSVEGLIASKVEAAVHDIRGAAARTGASAPLA